MKKYGQRKLPELWTAQTLRCSKVQRQLPHVHMPWLCQLGGSLLGSAIGDVKGTMDRRKKGQLFPISVSFSRAVLLCNGSLFQQHQLTPARSFPDTPRNILNTPSQSHQNNQLAAPPGRLGSQVHRVPLPPFIGSTEISVLLPMGPSSKCLSSHVSISHLCPEVLCVVWLKPPCNPYGSFCLFSILIPSQ